MRLLLFLILNILLFGCNQKQPTNYDLVIKNTNIIDIITGEIVPRDILISEGRIVKVAPANVHEGQYTDHSVSPVAELSLNFA